MPKKVWVFTLKDGKHIVELEHGCWSGKRIIIVDNVLLISDKRMIDPGSSRSFNVSGVPCRLDIRGGFIFKYDLYVDGKPVAAQVGRKVNP